jgi:peptide/nickel transport system substrate-binding protein
MRRPCPRLLRAAAILGAAAVLMTGCGADTATPSAQAGDSRGTQLPASLAPKSGGTIHVLTWVEQLDQIDPQRLYGSMELAFFGATVFRSLVSYTYSANAATAGALTPDMATDTGRASADATTWSFTLRDGLTFQDGSPVTCEDVKYGVSRTFATDVIQGGPTYAIRDLDIPINGDGSSQYPGPYTATPDQQTLYDRAVACDGNTIVFHLNRTVADFNYTTVMGFSPVPRAADTGETYGDHPVSSGPYQIDRYTPGSGGSLILVRNPHWNAASDPVRKAYPDRWEIDFGLDRKIIDQRLIESRGEDAYAIPASNLEPENLATVFEDPTTPYPPFAGRTFSALDPYVLYYWINVQKVPNVRIRQAIAAALDRKAIRLNAGGEFAGDLGDGLIKPNLGDQYAPTGLWDGLLGQRIPDNGDPAYARQLIATSGEAAPSLTWDYGTTPTLDREAAIVKDSLERAGFRVTLNPIDPNQYGATIVDPATSHELGWAAWGPDWPNASTVIPPLTTPKGGYDLSRVCDPACGAADDPDWLVKITAALAEVDHATQARMWQDLNREAMLKTFAIPIIFRRTQLLAGGKVQPVYQWAPYDSWPFGEMFVVP